MLIPLILAIGSLFVTEEDMRQNNFFIESPYDSLKISVMVMIPDTEPKAVVYLAHGLCGCKERFIPVMEYLTGHGIVCMASDHRGHGDSIRSEEDRGYMYQGGAESVIADMEAVTGYAEQHFHGVPLIMLGHSMGSLAARVYTKKNDIKLDGLIICGSPSPNPLAPVGRMIVKSISRKDNGRRRPEAVQKFTSGRYNRKFRKEGYQAWTCSDPDVRKAFADDPRCNFTITADCACTLMELMQQAYSKEGWKVAHPDMPVIFLSGEDDPCMISKRKFRKSVNQMKKRGYSEVEDITYPAMRHEILNETDKAKVWKDILGFVEKIISNNL